MFMELLCYKQLHSTWFHGSMTCNERCEPSLLFCLTSTYSLHHQLRLFSSPSIHKFNNRFILKTVFDRITRAEYIAIIFHGEFHFEASSFVEFPCKFYDISFILYTFTLYTNLHLSRKYIHPINEHYTRTTLLFATKKCKHFCVAWSQRKFLQFMRVLSLIDIVLLS